jgi:Protein of unknown function (DUF3300)
MRVPNVLTKILSMVLSMALLVAFLPTSGVAQNPQDQGAPPPSFSPDQLDKLVSRIALYPDPLLAQLLAAATFPDQIPDAEKWADQHHYLTGDQLATAIAEDHLPWDPAVQAMLPFPTVLDTMASDMNWTADLGNAFLTQRQDVMDAVQRMRQKAKDFGYLRTNGQVVVSGGPYIEIAPVNPAFICVPFYDPFVVYAAPRPGFVVGAAIGFGFGVTIGTFFRPWGWGYSRFDWRAHGFYIYNRPWGRVWGNRFTYVHAYGPGVRRWEAPRRAEGHALVQRSEHERNAWREGRAHVEEHHPHH